MKKSLVITSILASLTFTTPYANADTKKEQNVGFFSGAIAGFAVGGPIGFIVGGASGAILGDQVGKANQLDDVQLELAQQKADFDDINQQLASVQKQAFEVETKLSSSAQWMTQGLTLNLMFATNSTDLSTNDEAMINRLAKILKEFPDLNIKLDGYADPRGSETDNMELSKRRADVVRQAFQSQGIDSNRLISKAHGEANQEIDPKDLDAYAMERRVSINFVTKQAATVAQN